MTKCKKSDGKRMNSDQRTLAIAKTRTRKIARLEKIIRDNPNDHTAQTALNVALLERAGKWPSRKR